MSILEEGFLAPETNTYVERHRATHWQVLDLARDLNRLGQGILNRRSVPASGPDDVELLMFLLLVRVLSNFQCSVLLAETGALVESRTLSRACLETVFCLGALARGGDEFVQRMKDALLKDRTSTANWILQKPSVREAMGTAATADVRRYVDESSDRLEELRKLSIEEMARQSDMEPLYIWYRQMSGDAAHPTLDALERYVVLSDAGEPEIQWGPACEGEELEWTVLLSCNWLFAALHAVEERMCLGIDRDRLGDLWRRFEVLSRRSVDR